MKIHYFKSPEAFRAWLKKNHASETEVWVGYFKKETGKQGMSWAQAVDQALCYGWIDGIVKRVDDTRHCQRFTPRKTKSNWSLKNIANVERLKRDGLMAPAGLKAFESREKKRTGVYSFENRGKAKLSADELKLFRVNTKAWEFFSESPEGYRKTAIWLVISAKTEATRLKRLNALIEDSARGLRIKALRRP